MRRAIFLLVFGLLLLCSFDQIAAVEEEPTESFTVQSRRETANAKRINTQEAFDLFKSGKAVLISVDQAAYYQSRRILGSINIPYEIFHKTEIKYPKDKTILLFCR